MVGSNREQVCGIYGEVVPGRSGHREGNLFSQSNTLKKTSNICQRVPQSDPHADGVLACLMAPGDVSNDISIRAKERGPAFLRRAAALVVHAASVVICCRCSRSNKTPRQVLPYDNTRDQDVSLRELYGQAEEPDIVKVTWVTDQASSETSSEVVIPRISAQDRRIDTEHALVSRTQSHKNEQPEVLQQLHALAELTSPEPDKTTLPLTLLLDNTDLKRQVDSHDQTSALADQQDTGHLQEQVSDLEYEKEGLQGEVVTLQRQLTWLQSHACLQDTINKDLMQEVLHLREAVVTLSVVPSTEA